MINKPFPAASTYESPTGQIVRPTCLYHSIYFLIRLLKNSPLPKGGFFVCKVGLNLISFKKQVMRLAIPVTFIAPAECRKPSVCDPRSAPFALLNGSFILGTFFPHGNWMRKPINTRSLLLVAIDQQIWSQISIRQANTSTFPKSLFLKKPSTIRRIKKPNDHSPKKS